MLGFGVPKFRVDHGLHDRAWGLGLRGFGEFRVWGLGSLGFGV